MGTFRCSVIALLLSSWVFAAPQTSAKALFYHPLAGRPADTPHAYHAVGIRFWFRNQSGLQMSENRAANIPAHDLDLRIRSNTRGFITVWDMKEEGPVQLTPQHPDPGVNGGGRWNGLILSSEDEFIVPGKFQFATGERRLAVFFSRSQTEQPHRAAEVPLILARHAARKASDGLPMVVRDVEEFAEDRVGTYVVGREGSPVSAEIVLRSGLKRP
jgi:hypothetical protein